MADDPGAPVDTVPDSPDFGKIGKYDLVELVGEGAMGKVYRAQDPVLSRAVAIKLMSTSISQDTHLRDRFLREARAAANLQHPNIITIYDFGDAGGHPYIAMEFVEGTDLHHIIQDRQPVSLESKVTYLIGLLNGLAYAHTKGVVHRDIKPANIRVTASGHVKIMDFGIAHLSGSEMTHSGVVLGTPDYMAPEQVRGMPVTPQTDIWAAGAVLYELLTFEKPFSGETLHAVLFKVVTEEPPSITKLNPSLPEALERIVNTALNKEAGKRYAAADAMAADLSSVRKHLSELETKATLRFSRPLMALELPLMERLSRSTFGKGATKVGTMLAAMVRPVLGPAKAWLKRVPVPALLRSGSGALAAGGVAVIGMGAMVLVALAKGVPIEAEEVTARALVVSDTAPSAGPRVAAVIPAPVPPVVAQRSPRRGAGDTATRGRTDSRSAVQRPVTPTATSPKAEPVASVPAATATDPKKAVREAVERLERAMASADVARIKALYPSLSSSSAKGWEDFFRPKKKLTADFRPGDIKVKDETAELTFQMHFAFVDTAGAKKTIDWTGEGKLEKTPTGWIWKALGLKR